MFYDNYADIASTHWLLHSDKHSHRLFKMIPERTASEPIRIHQLELKEKITNITCFEKTNVDIKPFQGLKRKPVT